MVYDSPTCRKVKIRFALCVSWLLKKVAPSARIDCARRLLLYWYVASSRFAVARPLCNDFFRLSFLSRHVFMSCICFWGHHVTSFDRTNEGLIAEAIASIDQEGRVAFQGGPGKLMPKLRVSESLVDNGNSCFFAHEIDFSLN